MKKHILSLCAGMLLVSLCSLTLAAPAQALVLNKQKYLETARIQQIKMEAKIAGPLAKAAVETNPMVKAIYLAEVERIRAIYTALIEQLLALHEQQQEQLSQLPDAEEISEEVMNDVDSNNNTPQQTPVLYASPRIIRSR